MEPQQIIDLVVSLEKNLADFYRRLNGRERFKELRPIFKFMIEHSEIHAEIIGNYRPQAKIPTLDEMPLRAMHDKIENALYRQLVEGDDLKNIYEKLAHAEEIIGQVYSKLAAHYRSAADTYQKIASKFDTLAEDELQHKDYIYRNMPVDRENTTW